MDRKLKGIKDFLRGYPAIFRFLYRLTTPVFGKSPRLILKHVPAGGRVINLGSGVLSIDPRVIDVDFYPYPNVKIVADAANLPFEDGSVDGIICQSLLEHVADADVVIGEIKRVLKTKGKVCVIDVAKKGYENSKSLKIYLWFNKKFPSYTSSPIDAEKYLKNSRFKILKKEMVKILKFFPMQIVIAKK